MLSIFIPQDALEDILIDNMDASMEPEQQNVWYKIFTTQEVIYVSSWDDSKYLSADEPLFVFAESYGVELRYETEYIEGIVDNHELVTRYRNGVFLLDINKEDAETIQRDYGVVCQSIQYLDESVIMDPGIDFRPKKNEEGYSWDIILNAINAEHYPSNYLILIDRYLFCKNDDFDSALQNIYEILDVMLPKHQLKRSYKISIIVCQQEEAPSLTEIAKRVNDIVPYLKRPYKIDTEILYLTYLSGLYTMSHNRCILTNYTITQLENKIDAFEDGRSKCLQTITPQGLFTNSGLNGYCDSPYKTHHDIMSAIYNNIRWWLDNYLTTKSRYAFDGKETYINDVYKNTI